jgi:signal transduction histidine kinase/CheY-like chemotaxis protein
MAFTLRTRFRLYAAAVVAHSVVFITLAGVIVVPALLHVDRTLAPPESRLAEVETELAQAEARQRYNRAMRRLEGVAAAWLVSGALLLFVVGWDMRRRVLVPLRKLDAAVRDLGRGEWTPAPPPEGDDEVATLSRNFNEMAQALRDRAARHAQLVAAGELLAGVAHELNNPLQAIRASAELNAGSDTRRASEWRRVLKQATRAAKLVTDLLKFVRPSRRQARLVDVNGVAREGLDLIEFQYRADGIRVELELQEQLPPVHADPDELLQVVVNILGNAHGVLEGHTGPRQMWIRSVQFGGEVRLSIRDSGPGVPADVRDRIFAPFFSTRERGVGLGLAVSRDIVRRWGGRLMLDDAGPGASFTIALPAAVAPAAATTTPVATVTNGTLLAGRRVLVVDDEEAIRRVLVRFFARLGATAEGAEGGEAALDRMRTQQFDLVILDLRMPDLDGIAVFRRMRESHPGLVSRTIFLSGDISRIDADAGIDRDRVLVKPVELQALERVAGNVIAGAE